MTLVTDSLQLAAQLLRSDEGKRPRAYNDATGETMTCRPRGNLSIGYGINLETGLDDEEMQWLLAHRLQKIVTQLCALPWYQGIEPPRQAVLLCVAYNIGVYGLSGFARMIAAIAARDWKTAADQLLDSAAARALPARYQRYAAILAGGAL